jgi:3-hydroxybutyryl-CoA dehydrogenase
MGMGIAWLCRGRQKGRPVTTSKKSLSDKALERIGNVCQSRRKRSGTCRGQRFWLPGTLTPTGTIEDIKDVDYVVESVFENMEVKKTSMQNWIKF